MLFAALFGSITILHAHTPAPLPTDPTVVHGSAAFNTVGDHMTVTSGPGTILDWQSFSIGADHGVYFQQPDAASQVLNRVVGDDPSQILGSLGSNGGVWLINSHGVLFGQNARIDVAGLVTSTLDISNIDFLAGRYNFISAGGQAGQVANQGDIRTSFGGRGCWAIRYAMKESYKRLEAISCSRRAKAWSWSIRARPISSCASPLRRMKSPTSAASYPPRAAPWTSTPAS
jgi:filamentous hemagglutinin family protein